ncbi:hypothetical protein CRM22_000301 [Opisthorchis felineus]|uniref:Uncharacterized protein n=1 Tax=Opisthorchis felineus TaxID=147828 RepID=A0A4S2MFK2_OPIFE|nr:hypothetical protein CRM22_000301 [Opisthorchis felineus]
MVPFRMRIVLSLLCVVILIVVCIMFHCRRPLFDAQVCLGLRKSATDCLQCFGLPVQSYNYTVTSDELEFPLAYSILVYANPERAARLVAAIYRPHNFYCIHVDRKSSLGIVDLIKMYGQCFDSNVFFVPDEERTTVRWGYFSVLEPELTCTRLLLQRSRKWKYWINLTGQEFPLRTNLELVLALKALNGTNVVQATYKNRSIRRIPPRSAKSQNMMVLISGYSAGIDRETLNVSIEANCTKQVCCLYHILKCTTEELLKKENGQCLSSKNRSKVNGILNKLRKIQGCEPDDLGKLMGLIGKGTTLFRIKKNSPSQEPLQRPIF